MPSDKDDDLEHELEQIVKESGLGREPRPATSDPSVAFVTGMDFEKFMVTSHPGATDWRVFVRGAKGTEVPAEVLGSEASLNAWSGLGKDDAGWCVDSYLLPTGEDPLEVRIVIPGRAGPLVLRHPSRRS